METSPQPERRFVQRGLPWLIAAAGLLIYLATLNRWLTLTSLQLAATVNGWVWQPILSQPVLVLLTWPLKWLPAAWSPLALNLFAAACACLTLALLARSVALLPHDRLEQQRLLVQNEQGLLRLPNAWVPPVLAAAALGLQLTFWEHATAASGDTLDLLLFASVIWCVLEHRCNPRPRWLDLASFLCGIALANSWMVMGFVPLLAVALVRSRRLRFFNVAYLQRIETSAWKKTMPALAEDVRFFLRMVLFGLAGLSLILLLPLVNALSPDSSLSFWQALRAVASSYKNILVLTIRVCGAHRELTLLLAAVSLVPLLLLCIRWRTVTGPDSTRRLDLVSFILYAAHAFLLLLCVWVAFDPPISPRQLVRRLGFPLPVLPLCYLGAVSIGYYSGFFLLIFRGYLSRRRPLLRVLGWTAPKLVYALLGLTLVGLAWKNWPTIRLANGRQLEQYARFVVESLPPEGAVVCSQDPSRLAVLQAALAREAKAGRYVPVDVTSLPSERYRARLRRNCPAQWTEPEAQAGLPAQGGLAPAASQPLDLRGVMRLIFSLSQSNRVCYLHPGLGFLPELFHFQPHGLIYDLNPYPTNAFSGPLLSATELAENETFWKRVIETGVDPLTRVIAEAEHPRTGVAGWLMARARINRPLPDSLKGLARWYSSALNSWGVTLQRHGQWSAATPCFAKAGELNPDNLPARVNLQYNTNRLAGGESTLATAAPIEEQLPRNRNLAQVLTADGPFDDPTYCFQLGQTNAVQDLRHQAVQLLERAQALAPKEIRPRLLLGLLLNRWGLPDRALQTAAEMQADPKLQPLSPDLKVELAFLEADAWFVKTNQAKAVGILQALLDSHRDDPTLLARTKRVFANFGSYTNALRLTDQQLQVAPDDPKALLDKGLLCLMAGDFSNAIPVYTRLLSLTNLYAARLQRAQAYLQTGQLDAAADDYRETLRAFPTAYDPYQGLAEVAFRRGDTNAANQYYQQGLSNALRVTDQQLQLTPDNLQALVQKCALHMQAGEFSNAIPALTRLLSLTNSYPARMNRARAYVRTGQWDAAAADYQEALRVLPAAYEPYQRLAEVAFRRGDTNAANQYYQQYLSSVMRITDQQLQFAPDNLQALFNKGLLFLEAGQFSNAIPVFTRLLSLTNLYGGRIQRAQAYAETRQWDAAEADCQEALRAFPQASETLFYLAEVSLRRGDTNVAIQRYQQYLSKAPTNQMQFRIATARLQSLQPQTP